jgi:O-antigen/teichoic acid export membrane protein
LTLKEESLADDTSYATEESRHITRGIGSLTIQNLATSALGFVFLAVLLRLLPNLDYGIYSAMAVSVGIAAVIAPMGLQYAAAKYLSDTDDRIELRSRANKILTLSFLTSATATAAFILLANSLSLFFTKSPAWTEAFDVGGLWLFSSSMGSVVQGTVQGLKKYTALAGMLFVARTVMVFFTIIALVISHNLLVTFYAWIIYFTILILWSIRVLFADLGKAPRFENAHSSQSLSYKDLLRYSVPLGIAGIFFVLTTEVDLVVVGGDLNPSALGIYNTAVTISNVLNFVLITPLVTALLPEASFREKNPSEISNGMRLAIRFVVLSVLPASFLVAAVSPQLLELFSGGALYQLGSEPLEIIAIFYVFFAVQYVVYSILQAKGRTIQVFAISGFTAASIFGLSLVLVPQFGLVGAAVARSMTAIVGMVVALYIGRSFLSNLDKWTFYVKALLAAAIPFSVDFTLTSFVSDKSWTIVPFTLIGAGIFLACLSLFKVLNDEDKTFFYGAMPSSIRKKLQFLSR